MKLTTELEECVKECITHVAFQTKTEEELREFLQGILDDAWKKFDQFDEKPEIEEFVFLLSQIMYGKVTKD